MSTFPKVLLFTLSTVLVLGILEAGSHLVGHFEGPKNPVKGGYIREVGQHDDRLFWKLKPGYRDRAGLISINSRGLRGPEIRPKGPTELRILSLGESTTFAARLAYENSYSDLVEKRLQEELSDKTVRVINGGVPGYTLFQGTQYLLAEGVSLRPDLVILYFGFNDFLRVSFLAKRSGEENAVLGKDDKELYLERRAPLRRLAAFLRQRSNLYRGLLSARNRSAANDQADVKVDPSRVRVPEEVRRELLERVIATCARQGIKLAIVIPW